MTPQNGGRIELRLGASQADSAEYDAQLQTSSVTYRTRVLVGSSAGDKQVEFGPRFGMLAQMRLDPLMRHGIERFQQITDEVFVHSHLTVEQVDSAFCLLSEEDPRWRVGLRKTPSLARRAKFSCQ